MDSRLEGAATVLETVNREHGTAFMVVQRLSGGYQSGAYLLESADGPAVLKWSQVRSWASQVQRAATVVARMRAAGWPTPAWLAVGTTPDGYPYQIQQFVDGTPMSTLGMAEIRLLLELVRTHAGIDPDPGRGWSEHTMALVFGNQDGCREAVRASGPHGAAIVGAFMRLCAPYRDIRLPDKDLVHGDLSAANVLVVNGAIAGVIDVEAIGSGTRVIDLAGLLREGYLSGKGQPDAMRWLRQEAEAVAGHGVFTICAAASVFGVLDFMLRRGPHHLTRCLPGAMHLVDDLARRQ